MNLYAYCRNNPVHYEDPSGHWCEKKQDVYNQLLQERHLTEKDLIDNPDLKLQLMAEASNIVKEQKRNSSNSSANQAENPRDYLNYALSLQGLSEPTKKFHQKWSDGTYNYEVRIHPGEPQWTSAETIYRVSRKKVPSTNPSVQGSGMEYLGSDGKWYHESTLRATNKLGDPNPQYNDVGARVTYIPL